MLVVVEPAEAVGNGVGAPFSTTPQAARPALLGEDSGDLPRHD